MENIIIGIYHVYPTLSHCKELHFIIGQLLYIMDAEDLTFWLVIGLMQKYRLELIYMANNPVMPLHLHLLKNMVKIYTPKLDSYLISLNINWDIFIERFILTLGSAYVPTQFLPQVFDVFFMDGWIGLYKIVIGLLDFYKESIFKMNLEEIKNFLDELRHKLTINEMKAIAEKATYIKIEKDSIEKSIDMFFKDKAGKYLSKDYNKEEWPAKFAKILEAAFEDIKKLTSQHEIDMELYGKKLAKIESSLTE